MQRNSAIAQQLEREKKRAVHREVAQRVKEVPFASRRLGMKRIVQQAAAYVEERRRRQADLLAELTWQLRAVTGELGVLEEAVSKAGWRAEWAKREVEDAERALLRVCPNEV